MPALPAPIPILPPLQPRQDADHRGSVSTTYGALYSSPQPGLVAGIVLACIAGYLLVIWVVYTCLNIGPPVEGDTVSTYLGGESVVTLSTVRRSSKSRRVVRPVRARERIEVRTRSRGGGPRPEIVEEPESESDVFMGGGRSGGRGGRTVSTVSEDDTADDEIIVEEEHRGPRRGSRYGRSRGGSSYDDSYYERRRSRRRSERDY